MLENKFSKSDSDITAEACAWLAQIETGDMGRGDVRALKEWIARSPRHYHELSKIAKLSEDMNVLGALADPISADMKAHSPMVRKKQNGWTQRWRPLAASFVIIASLATVSIVKLNQPAAPEPYLITTLIGGNEERVLSDGSVIKLNTDSVVEIDFVKTQRRVRLVKGEAFFEVAHNAERPFIVYVDDKMVKAVGTAFGVRWTNGDLFVTVSEGRVAFAPLLENTDAPLVETPIQKKNTPPIIGQLVDPITLAKPQFLDAGDKLTILKEIPIVKVAEFNPKQIKSELAWRTGILDFSQRPLSEVIDEINRYSDLKIEVIDSELRNAKFGGLFRIGDTDALFDVLELSFDVKVERVNDKLVRIQPASSQ